MEIEARVDALERAVDEMRDTSALEERIVARVLERTGANAGGGSWLRRLNPFARGGAPTKAATGWLLWDLVSEARMLLAMLFDPRFSMPLSSRIVLYATLGLIVTSHWWFPLSWFWGIGVWIDKLMTLILGFFVFTILSRETRRHRDSRRQE